MAQVTCIVIDHEIFSTVIRNAPLLLNVQKLHFLKYVTATTSTGKLFHSLPRNGATAELCSGKINVAY
jgi:hypothetical protein